MMVFDCAHGEFHGIRRDGWPSTMHFRCGVRHDACAPWAWGVVDCELHEPGEPRYFDKHGVEITREELDAIPNPMGGD